MNKDFFISVDWGTSTFRLRTVNKSSLQKEDEIILPVGVRDLYQQWQQEGGDRELMFLNFLNQQISQLKAVIPVEETEVVISGMASSNIGICELQYLPLPLNILFKGLFVKHLQNQIFPHGIYLISGICSNQDIMRGEETQLLGLITEEDFQRKSMFILPGTHSKHILCDHGIVADFDSFMTGELFQAICEKTIIKNSVTTPPSEFANWKSFEEGVFQSRKKKSLLNELLRIRSRNILDNKTPAENYYFLSGLLIGEELVTLKSRSFDKLLLCAGRNLYAPYYRALQVLELDKKAHVIDELTVEDAVCKGQLRVLNQYRNSKT
ncbi:MAG: 2-dehydro-3-deoxygalactonokinase [Bacteroidetes bacterium]|nr:2-dehydro-3-deoxygalactonokinase [Bacteroidota bacterium]MBS1929983.1 2-dehydro-3-deoxygalactonokinase [Bacteroidota bacterium]